jgi:ribosomal-protein-alanine N-acetyltransferase
VSARLKALAQMRLMTTEDLAVIETIEQSVYTHPWTRGNFADSLAAGYQCRILEQDGRIAGYAVLMLAAGEAHLLNLSIAGALQRRGLGSELLRFMTQLARDCGAQTLYLEVRASNQAGRALYARHGFAEIGTRRGYYPAHEGREDAVTMEKKLA